jgi:ATP-dependent Clp protease ATP-binding subunit ClpX
MGCYGDAAIEIDGTVTGATSTVIGAMVMQAVVCRGIELAKERGTGARGLRAIMEEIMQPIMYESPTLRDEKGISKIVITEKTVKEKAEPEYIA